MLRIGFLLASCTTAALAGAAGGCEEMPLCSRIAVPGVVFFVGEATEERSRDGHDPEYRFRVREPLVGLAPGTEWVTIETAEGPPPAGLLLVQARRRGEDGSLERRECDFASPDFSRREELTMLRRMALESSASLQVVVRGEVDAAQVRIWVDGPISRLAGASGRFPSLPAGVYRVTVSAPGHEEDSHRAELPAGSCPVIEIPLRERR